MSAVLPMLVPVRTPFRMPLGASLRAPLRASVPAPLRAPFGALARRPRSGGGPAIVAGPPGLGVDRGFGVDGRPRRATCDVLVVGAGPGGLTTAAALARLGVHVLVVDRHAATSIFPRATGVSTRTMEVMRAWGLEERVRAGAMSLRPFVSMSRMLGDRDLVEMPIGFAPPTEDAAALSPTTPCFCAQDHLEPVLLEDVRAHGGQVRFDTELTGFAMDDDGVTATLRFNGGRDHRGRRSGGRDHGGTETSVRARFLVGADGPRSAVRAGLGIDVEDLGHLGEWVSVLFGADLSGVVGDRRYVLHAVGSREEPALFVPTGNDDRWQYAW
ncbi:MAG: FAD-dependent monooxygenase, partial [Mycobacterium leprae]